MNLKQIETFVWVATLGSFRKAAEKLNSSQPAVSSRIRALEDLLDTKLFERHAGGFSLTAKGVELLPMAQKLLVMGQRMQSSISDGKIATGVLRLGVSETIVHCWLSDFLRRAASVFPNLNIEVNVDVTSNLRDDLITRSLDLAFLMGPVSDYRIENRDLCSYEVAWFRGPSLDVPDGIVPIEQLVQMPIVTFARNTRPFAEVHALSQRDEIDALRLFPSTSLAACVRMAEDGVGIGMLPVAVVKDQVDRGQLLHIESTWAPPDLVFTASYPREPEDTVAARCAELAIETAQGHGDCP